MRDTAGSSSGRYYTMTANNDASATATWNDTGTTTTLHEGFKPIGAWSSPDTTSFRGIFDGKGRKITGLAINRPTADRIGVFGHVGQGGWVRRVDLRNCQVTGDYYVGSLVGSSFHGIVSNCQATGAVTGDMGNVGGLVGFIEYGSLSECRAACVVTGILSMNLGGLVGQSKSGTISLCFATNSVTGSMSVGGLVGLSDSGMASDCYATGAVNGDYYVGGLIGSNDAGTVTNSYATGAVTGSFRGGLVGDNAGGSAVNSYWDVQTSGISTPGAGTGKTTAQMKQQATFVGWNFDTIWGINENVTYPYLLFSADTDGDGVGDALDACPGTIAGATVDAQGCPPDVFGDFNRDGAVDNTDLDIFTACAKGPSLAYNPQNPPIGCILAPVGGFLPADHDQDLDMDSADFAVFQRCWSGPLPADPNCDS
jgi:hypothetical protein